MIAELQFLPDDQLLVTQRGRPPPDVPAELSHVSVQADHQGENGK